jgi:hypothetical protein
MNADHSMHPGRISRHLQRKQTFKYELFSRATTTASQSTELILASLFTISINYFSKLIKMSSLRWEGVGSVNFKTLINFHSISWGV